MATVALTNGKPSYKSAMNNHARNRSIAKNICFFLTLLPLLFLLNCTDRPMDETARSGKMTLALDRSLEDIAHRERDMFTGYYPEARITLLPDASANTLRHLLDHSARAALIGAAPEAGEDSLFAQLNPPLRREPVARDAIICIVNRHNPLKALSVNRLEALLSRSGEGTPPFVREDDYRLRSVFARRTRQKSGALRALSCSSDLELIGRVAAKRDGIGLLFLSAFDSFISSGTLQDSVRILPLVPEGRGVEPVFPTRKNIFNGGYPLVTTVYYVYYSGDALPAGFGSWFAGSGQKAIERSSFTPWKMIERTILLK